MNIDSICEKTLLIDAPKYGKWSPDMSMLVHVASINDHGAHPECRKENIEEMKSHGMRPQLVKLTLIVSVEYLGDPISDSDPF